MIFKKINDLVATQQAAEFYGMKVKKRGSLLKGLCPFHKEKTPSFCIYPDGGFKCFGCSSSGTGAVSFLAKLLNVRPIEAAKRIDSDFRLGLFDGNQYKNQRIEPTKYDFLNGLKSWQKKQFIMNANLYHNLEKMLRTFKNPGDDFESQQFIELIKLRNETEVTLEKLNNSTLNELFELYELERKGEIS